LGGKAGEASGGKRDVLDLRLIEDVAVGGVDGIEQRIYFDGD